MSQGLYIASAEPRSGKSVVVLGVMELLTGQGKKVGFFRPVIRSGEVKDGGIHLIAAHFDLPFPYEAMYGCTNETARNLIAAGRHGELFGQILEKYKSLEAQCELVVCSGTDFSGVVASIELEINLELANNLGCLVVPVIRGFERTTSEVVTAAIAFEESVKDNACEVVATFVNRVGTDQIEEVRDELKRSLPALQPLYVVPEQPLLGKPTIGEVVTALNAECLSCEAGGLEREVSDYKVAAMELPNFLKHLGDRSLVIAAGDRSDIILGSLLADASETYPQVAGLLLTGNLRPASEVQRLIDGFGRSPVPVFSVATDTFETATAVSSLEGSLVPENGRKIAAALGALEAGVDLNDLQQRIAVTRSSRVTPLMFEYELAHRAKSDRKHIVLPEGTDERILRAAEILRLRDVVDLTLLGEPANVKQKIDTLGLCLPDIPIIDPATSELRQKYADRYFELRKHKGISQQMAHDTVEDVSYFGTMMVHFGDADGMVSGAVHTTQHTIRPSFEIIKTKPGCSIVSSVFLMCLADRVLVYGDCAVNPNPTAEQLADIAVSSAGTARMFGIEPYVAMLSYSTGESGKGEDVERVREATRIAREKGPDLKIEGPIQYDAAVDAGVAKSKLPGSEVAGHATVFIFPDLNTGNNTYKAVQRSAGAVAIGPVLQGLNKPVNDLSRGCLVADIVNTVAITAIQAGERG